MKKIIVITLMVLFVFTGCISKKKENPEPEINITAETMKIIDKGSVKINFVSTHSETAKAEEIEVVTNASDVDVILNGSEVDLVNGVLTLPSKTNNSIKFVAKRDILGEEFTSSKEMTVIRSDIASSSGSMIFPNNDTLYNSYGLAEDGNAGAKKTAVKGVAALGNIVYRAITTKDITDVPVVKAELQGIYADVSVTGLTGGNWTNGDNATIYVVLNGSVVDQLPGTVVNGKIQYQTVPADTAEKITIGKPLATSTGAVTDYKLMEGTNTIYLFVVNATDSTKASIRVGDGSNPVSFVVDTVRPTLTITTPVNDGYLSYNAVAGVQNVKFKANAKDTNWVYMYGTILKTANTSTINETSIGTAANMLMKSGAQIKSESELEIAMTGGDLNVDASATGTKDYFVLMAKDRNGNATIRFVTVSKATAVTSDESALEVRDGTGSQTTALYNKYVDNLAITDTNISFRYTLQPGEVGSTVRIIKKAISSGNTPVELPLTKTLTPLSGEPRILVGDFNLITDFGYTAEEVAKPELNMNLYLEITDVNGTETEIPLIMRHMVFSSLVSELKMSKGDLEFRTATDGVFQPLPNGYSDKIYFDDNSDGDIDSKADIGKIVITKPVNREYVMQIGENTYYVDSDNTVTLPTPIVMDKNNPVVDIYIYFRNVSAASFLGKFTVVYLTDPASTVTINQTVIKQNLGKIEVSGSINMPISVVSEYTFSTSVANATPAVQLRDSGTPSYTTYTANITNFNCTVDFNFSDIGNSVYDMLYLNLKNKDNIIVTSPKTINLDDNVTNSDMAVYKINLEGVEDTNSTWSIPVSSQRIFVSNAGSFQTLEFLFDGQKDSSFVNGTYYATLGSKSSLTIRGKIPNVEVWVERKIAIKLVSTTAPTFENSDSAKKVKVIKDASNVMKVKGYVTNHLNTDLNIYIDDVLLNPVTANMPPYILYEGTDTQYLYSKERPFITVDLGSPERQGTDFTIKLTARDRINQITGYYIITDPTYYDTYAPTQYYPGKNAGSNRRFPDEWKNTVDGTKNSLDRYYVKYDSTADSAELYVDDKASELSYGNALASSYIENNLTIGENKYHIINKNGTQGTDIKFGFLAGDPGSDDGYFAVIQNQTGSSDYLIGRIPKSQSDADYTALEAAKNETVYIVIKKDTENEVWLTVDSATDTVTSSGVPTTLVDGFPILQTIAGTRSFVYNIGDNLYNQITIKLADKHKVFTESYTFTNTNTAPISTSIASAEIIEGNSLGSPISRVVLQKVANLKGTTVEVYSDSALTNKIGGDTDLDLTTGVTYIGMSNVKGGDKVYLVVTDKYGNKIKGGSLTLTVADKVPPVLPGIGDITADNSGASSDKLTFKIEPGAEVFFINDSTIPATYDLEKAASVGKVTYTDIKDANGNITGRTVVAEIARSAKNKDLKLVMADPYKNLTYNSKFDENQYLNIASKVVYQYSDIIPGDISVDAVTGSTIPYGLDESFVLSWEPITTGDLQYYKVVFVVDNIEYVISDKLTATNITIKGQDLIDKYKIPAFNYYSVGIRVSGISKKGIEGNYKTPNGAVYMDTKRPDLAAIKDKSKILAYVAKDDAITFDTGSFDRTLAGIGASGDEIYVAVCNTTITSTTTNGLTTYSASYDATKNIILATKKWGESDTSITISGTNEIGAIENTSYYMIRIIDAAGNISAVPATPANYIVHAIDNEAPKLTSMTLGGMVTSTGEYFGTIPLKYIPPTNAGEGAYVKVYIYAYANEASKSPSTQKLMATATLKQELGYEIGTNPTVNGTGLQIDFSKHPEAVGGILPDASKVFMRLGDSAGNVTDIANEVRLSELIANFPMK